MNPPFKYFPIALQVFFLFSLLIICSQGLTQLAYYALYPVFGVEKPEEFIKDITLQAKYVNASILWQSLGSAIGAFIIPSILFSFLISGKFFSTLKLNQTPNLRYYLLALVAIISAGVFISFLVDLSQHIALPESLKPLENLQENYDTLIKAFFAPSSILHLYVLTIALAVLPAVGEEMFFRGHIQQLCSRTFLGNIGAIVFTGFVFSLLHFEFRNFLAIWVMGIVLGFIFYYTQSLWVSIFAHFTNNFIEVLFKWLFSRGVIAQDIAESSSFPIYITFLSAFILLGSIYLFKTIRINPIPDEPIITQNESE
jgi:membrane protease YdiL (CAAX protease family)